MKHTMTGNNYIVIKLRRDSLRKFIRISSALLLIAPYPLLTCFHLFFGLPEDVFLSRLPVTLLYTLIAPALLAALSAHSMTGAPIDRRMTLGFAVCNLIHIAALGACVFLFLSVYPSLIGKESLFSFLSPVKSAVFQEMTSFTSVTRRLLCISIFLTALLWLCEIICSDRLGEYFWAGYFINAGGCAAVFKLLDFLSQPNQAARYAAGLRESLLPLAEGGLLCIILLIALLLQAGSPSERRTYASANRRRKY